MCVCVRILFIDCVNYGFKLISSLIKMQVLCDVSRFILFHILPYEILLLSEIFMTFLEESLFTSNNPNIDIVYCTSVSYTHLDVYKRQEMGSLVNNYVIGCVVWLQIITSGGVTYKNEPWHRECFTCTNCNTSLAGQRFTSRDEKPYCADCFGELFAKRCTACCKPITGKHVNTIQTYCK